MKQAHCCECGKRFLREADEEWRVRCIPCYKKFKRADSLPADNYWPNRAAAAESRAVAAESLAATLKRQLEQQARIIQVLQASRNAKPTSSFDRELSEHWRALIQCCHPDKHNGSQGATRLTQWLNDLKGRLPCA